MRTNRWVFLALILMGLVVAEAAAAQSGVERQRAPGVPLAPKPGVVDEELAREDIPLGVDRPAPALNPQQERKAERGAEQNIPMPKPVPSIIR